MWIIAAMSAALSLLIMRIVKMAENAARRRFGDEVDGDL
jgi:hypothetical protein